MSCPAPCELVSQRVEAVRGDFRQGESGLCHSTESPIFPPMETRALSPRVLARASVDRIVERFALAEDAADDGGPRLELQAPGNGKRAGVCRSWTGGPIERLVYVALEIDAIGLDSHMLYAFTTPESAVPHFTLDAVAAPGTCAFHLDLVPRVDLGAHLEYVRYCYDILTDTTLDVASWEGLSPASLTPLQYSMTSPWMLVHRVTESDFARVGEPVGEYLAHWFALVEDGLPPHVSSSLDMSWLPERDRRLRAALFDPAVDPAWGQMDSLVGADDSAAIRSILRGD